MQADLTSALDRLGRYQRGEADDRQLREARIAAHRAGEVEAAHARHLDVGEDDVEALSGLQQDERFLRRCRAGDGVARGLQHRRQHVAEERRVVDQQHAAPHAGGGLPTPVRPILEGERQEMADVDDLGGLTLDHRRAEHARALAGELDVEAFFDNVDDLVDDQRHGAALIGEHQQRLYALAFDLHLIAGRNERDELAAILHERTAARHFDAASVDLLEPRDQRERHGLRLRRPGAEQQQRFGCGLFDLARAVLIVAGDWLAADASADRVSDAVRLDDHDYRAVAEDRVAAEHRDVAKLARHRLHDDFFGMEDAVDHEAEQLAADLHHHDEAILDPAVAVADFEQRRQMHEWQELVAQPQHGGILDAFDAMLGIAAHPHQLNHRKLRDGEAITARLHDQRRDDGKRERNLDMEAGAAAWHRADVDGAADLVDIVAHDIHADAAAGHARHLAGGGEARHEDEAVDLRLRHLLQLGRAGEVAGEHNGLDPIRVETATIVSDFDDDVAALM